MLEKIGKKGFETISTPDEVVLDTLSKVLQEKSDPVVYEIGVGIGATTLEIAKALDGNGLIVPFSRAGDVAELAEDLSNLGFTNIVTGWGSPNKTFSGYHFELARGFVEGALPEFDLAYVDGGHTFHLDAPAAVVLKELCRPGGYILFDDYNWTFAMSPTLAPEVRPQTLHDYDELQITTAHVELVCKIVMNTDPRFEALGIVKNTAIYRRR